MAAESLGAIGSPGASLLDDIEANLKASNMLHNGQPNGMIASLDRARYGYPDGKDTFTPAVSHVRDLDVAATYANKKPIAKRRVSDQAPDRLHVVAEYGDRYLGATGHHTLHELARISMGVVLVAADEAGSRVRGILTGESAAAVTMDDTDIESYEVIDRYDKVARDGGKPKNGKSPLRFALEMTGAENLNPDSDVAVVVSDFVRGAQYGNDGELVSFDWEDELEQLHDELKDRLYVVRLVTPAQIYLPETASIAIQGQRFDLSEADYLRFRKRYEAVGQQKAARIADVLHHIRHLDLNSWTKAPIIELTDFVFGEPEE